MKLTPEVVRHVAKLARLELSDAELKKFSRDLNDILAAFKELDKAPVKGVEPSFQPLPTMNIVRQDITGKSLANEDALKNTKHKEKGFFRGPRSV